MPRIDKGTREYRSPRRERQAEATREGILAAAEALIAERGYASTTIAAIAERAEVAVSTVYFVFGSKRAILSALHDRVTERADLTTMYAQVMTERDPRRQTQGAAHIVRHLSEAAPAIIEAARTAGTRDPELQAMWRQSEANRRKGLATLIQTLVERGHLRLDLTPEQATDILWSMVSHELYHLFVAECGWSGDGYERWVAETVDGLILR